LRSITYGAMCLFTGIVDNHCLDFPYTNDMNQIEQMLYQKFKDSK